MTFKQVCALLGGPSKVSRILGLKDKSIRDVRRAVAENKPRPHWMPRLKEYAINHIEELKEFVKE